jgi:hypothetical protein
LTLHFRQEWIRETEARLSPLSPSAEAYAAIERRCQRAARQNVARTAKAVISSHCRIACSIG